MSSNEKERKTPFFVHLYKNSVYVAKSRQVTIAIMADVK